MHSRFERVHLCFVPFGSDLIASGALDSFLSVGALNDSVVLLFASSQPNVRTCTTERECGQYTENWNFTQKSMFIHPFLETTPLLATVFKHVYLWNWNSHEAGSGLILEVINCALTWNSKQEIDG